MVGADVRDRPRLSGSAFIGAQAIGRGRGLGVGPATGDLTRYLRQMPQSAWVFSEGLGHRDC